MCCGILLSLCFTIYSYTHGTLRPLKCGSFIQVCNLKLELYGIVKLLWSDQDWKSDGWPGQSGPLGHFCDRSNSLICELNYLDVTQNLNRSHVHDHIGICSWLASEPQARSDEDKSCTKSWLVWKQLTTWSYFEVCGVQRFHCFIVKKSVYVGPVLYPYKNKREIYDTVSF